MVTIDRDRYVVFRILPYSIKTEPTDLKRIIWSIYQRLYGLDGTTEAGLYFEDYYEHNNLGLVRCSSKSLDNLMTSFAMITTINDNEILILPIFSTGLVNKAKKFIHTLSSPNHNVD